MKRIIFYLLWSVLVVLKTYAQQVTLDGYVFEELNRGFLNEVKITILDMSGVWIADTRTDLDGHFTQKVDIGKTYILQFEKKIFKTAYDTVSTAGTISGDKIFIKKQLERQPGYLLEVTLAEKRKNQDAPVDAVNGSRIEIFNLTTQREELVIASSESPVFSHTLQQGNHYIIMVRKKGFLTKRLEARVNVEGCYLCMEGFGKVTPGVMDNLSAAKGNTIGTLLANIELEKVWHQKTHDDDRSLAEIVRKELAMKQLNSGEFNKEYKMTESGTLVQQKPQPTTKATPPILQPQNRPETTPTRSDDFDTPQPQQGNVSPRVFQQTISVKPATPSVEKPLQTTQADVFDDGTPSVAPVSAQANLKPIGNYTGYKIQIFTSPQPLSVKDPDIKMLAFDISSDIFTETLKNGQVAYLVGILPTYGEAERFLQSIVSKYPAAKLVEYYNGKRL